MEIDRDLVANFICVCSRGPFLCTAVVHNHMSELWPVGLGLG